MATSENQRSSEERNRDMNEDEEDLIARLHRLVGDRWALIAGRIPGRSAEEIEKYWNSTRGSSKGSQKAGKK